MSVTLTVHIARQAHAAQRLDLTAPVHVAQALRALRAGLRRIPRRTRRSLGTEMETNTMKQVLPIAAVVALATVLSAGYAHAGVVGDVPEPGSLTLVGAGAAIVAVGAWWRSR